MNKLLQSIEMTLQRSPIVMTEKSLPMNGELLDIINANRIELGIIMEKSLNPLKIVLMGEVKAGKSTLINTFVEDIVSPTDVTETTACIIEISHSTQRNGTIYLKDKEISDAPEAVFQTLREKHGDKDFFESVSSIKLGLPLPKLRTFQLVDTPGLGTVTTENEKLTTSYIQESDVVLWVFNAHHMGQADIEEEVENVASYGKPIIGVINRIDEVSGTSEQLESYIKDSMGFYLNDAFAISAKDAFYGIMNNDSSLLEVSRFPVLLSYLENEIQKNESEVHEQSIGSSSKALLEKERIQHKLFSDNLNFLLRSMESRKQEIDYHNEYIKKNLAVELQSWISNEFLEAEKSKLLKQSMDLSVIAKKSTYEDILTELHKYTTHDYIYNQLEDEFKHLSNRFIEEWNIVIESINEKIKMEEEEFRLTQLKSYSEHDLSAYMLSPKAENQMQDGAIKGAAIGGAYGLASATYIAVLGPSAAAVTLGTALSAIMPPVLIVGALVGVATKFVTGDKKKREFAAEITRAINDAKLRSSQVFLQSTINQVEEASNRFATELYERLCSFLSEGWTERELQDLQLNIEIYSSQLLQLEQALLNRAEGLKSTSSAR